MPEVVDLDRFRREKHKKVKLEQTPAGEIRAVANGVFVANYEIRSQLLPLNRYFTASNFATMSEKVRKPMQYGYDVLSSVALKAIAIDQLAAVQTEGTLAVTTDTENSVYGQVTKLMHDPEKIKAGSRHRVLLGREFVRTTLLYAQGITPINNMPTPELDNDERRFIAALINRDL
ncbi:MAG: hypothetical protein WAR37_03690 [Candidatus Microsaccharimonas sp.]